MLFWWVMVQIEELCMKETKLKRVLIKNFSILVICFKADNTVQWWQSSTANTICENTCHSCLNKT